MVHRDNSEFDPSSDGDAESEEVFADGDDRTAEDTFERTGTASGQIGDLERRLTDQAGSISPSRGGI